LNNRFKNYAEIKSLVADDLEKMSSVISDVLLRNHTDKDFSEELNHYCQSGSKQLRSCLIFLFARAIHGKVCGSTIKLAAAVEIIHNATLIHDDIIDSAKTRRGQTSIHIKYGNKLAILAGDFLLSIAISILSEMNNSIVNNFAQCLNSLCKGEIEQYFEQKTTPSIEQYLEKSQSKTASLFIAGLKSLGELNEQAYSENLSVFAKHFGTAFQISDDLKNFTEQTAAKPAFNDIESGIYTAPVIYAFGENKDLSSVPVKNIIDAALAPIAQTKTIDLLNKEKNLAAEQLQPLPESVYKQALIDLCNLI